MVRLRVTSSRFALNEHRRELGNHGKFLSRAHACYLGARDLVKICDDEFLSTYLSIGKSLVGDVKEGNVEHFELSLWIPLAGL